MSMQHIESELRKQGEENLADLIASVHKMNGKDIPFPAPKVTTVEEPVLKTPESVTNFWRLKLQADGKKIGLDIKVPDCDWTTEEIKKPMIDYKGNQIASMMVYVPEELTGTKGLRRLGKMYPEINNVDVSEDTFDTHWATKDAIRDCSDKEKKAKWVKVEATADCPSQDDIFTWDELDIFAKKQGYAGQTLNTYILASQASKDLRGKYFDEKSDFCLLTGSRSEKGGIPQAYFQPNGNLLIAWLYLGDFVLADGVRFETTKKT